LKLRVSNVAIERYRSWAEDDGDRKDRSPKQIRHIVVNGVRSSSGFQQLERLLGLGEPLLHHKITVDLYDQESYFGRFVVVLGKDRHKDIVYDVITLYPEDFTQE